MKAVVMYSGGIGSFEAAKRTVKKYGADNVILLFADTLIEDETLYTFLDETSKFLGARLERIADGRTPWQVFKDERFIGNSRVDPCSKILKRQICDHWLDANCDRQSTIVILGIDWTEDHRAHSARDRFASNGWDTEFPLLHSPVFNKNKALEALAEAGIEVPRLYQMGFAHNNCGGFCVKAGKGHFARLWRELPEVYYNHEREEEAMRRFLGKDVSVLREQVKGVKRNLTLREFRERLENGTSKHDPFDIGGCGCFNGEA